MLIESGYSLETVFREVRDQLKRANSDKKHHFRFFSVATSGLAGQPVQSRIVVLRSFSDEWEFEFYTDHRSSKVEQIKNNPMLSALFWDPSKQVQVRMEARAVIHHEDDHANDHWMRVQGDARKAYTSLVVPGNTISAPEEAHQWPEELYDDHFSVIRCESVKILILQISGLEHLAYSFQKNRQTGNWQGSRTAP